MQRNAKKSVEDLANKFREQVYYLVIPLLANGIKSQFNQKSLTPVELQAIYLMAMKVFFKLLFVAYAEYKDLLPHRSNAVYRKHSLKTIAEDLLVHWNSGDRFGTEFKWWKKTQAIFRAFEDGNSDWDIPAYGRGLFSFDQSESRILAHLEKISLPDEDFGRILQRLLLLPGPDGEQALVDFCSLGLAEFGTIYEGLLESELTVAETDLFVEKKGEFKDTYLECLDHEAPDVLKGQIYLSNSSGTRKSSGSYYTKNFVVEHLLDNSLEKSLDDHFKLLDSLDDVEAGEAFFDFKVADIAMGSGHFLVAAVDRIESRFSNYLSKRNLPEVFKELSHLRESAIKALGEAANSYPEIEEGDLLRRQIARRCIYGVDINEVAVHLARISLWIHTFVPGLPLSLLERNLVHGNSLIGVGRISEFKDKLREDEVENLFSFNIQDMFLGSAIESLARIGKIAEATKNEIYEARRVWKGSDESISSVKVLCDILTAARIEKEELPLDFTHWSSGKKNILESMEHKKALEVIGDLNPFHFPVAFPEVFLRKKEGFDVILGNPPWKEVIVEELDFWIRYYPGLRGLKPRVREGLIKHYRENRPELVSKFEDEVATAKNLRRALINGPFPGMGSGDPDLYKAFCWRFLVVTENSGQIGVVLPRGVFSAKGSTEFRMKLFTSSSSVDITTLVNNKHWVFDEGHPQWTYGLLAIQRGIKKTTKVELSGPYNSLFAFQKHQEHDKEIFSGKEIIGWNDTASLPLLPTKKSLVVFKQMRENPRLDFNEPKEWRARPHRELDASNDKIEKITGQKLMDLDSKDCPEGFWPIYKGESFDLWQPDKGKGSYYAWGNPKVLKPRIQAKRVNAKKKSTSVFNECDSEWCENLDTLPCLYPRLAFRDSAQATDKRTMRCALVPPKVFIANQAPYFVFPRGSKKDVTYLLGILSSIPLDWYSRRFVDRHLSFFIINPFPIPRPDKKNPLRKRVIELAGRLACPDERFAEWAKEIGVEFGSIKEDEKQDMNDELDAVVARLYGLSKAQLVHIFETFHVGWNYHSKLEATLKHYQNI